MRALLLIIGVILGCPAVPLQAAPVYADLVVFGASLNTSGNGGPLAETPPYGPGRWSNGLVAAEYLAQSVNPAVSAGNIAGLITDLHSAGARNFLFLNLYDLGFSPNGIGSPSPGVSASNLAYASALAGVRASLDINLVELDVFALFNQVRAAPGEFGLANVANACYDALVFGGGTQSLCTDPDSYFWWDTAHPTTAGHAIIGAAALNTVVPLPPSAWLLSSGLLAGVGWVRRKSNAHR